MLQHLWQSGVLYWGGGLAVVFYSVATGFLNVGLFYGDMMELTNK